MIFVALHLRVRWNTTKNSFSAIEGTLFWLSRTENGARAGELSNTIEAYSFEIARQKRTQQIALPT